MNVPFSLLCNTRFPFNFYLWPTLKFITIPFLFKALPKGSMYFLARDTQYTVFFNLLIRIWNNFWANFVFFFCIFLTVPLFWILGISQQTDWYFALQHHYEVCCLWYQGKGFCCSHDIRLEMPTTIRPWDIESSSV